MPTPEEIANEQQQLYESASLRDDLNDAEATVLLKWGQTQVERMAQLFPDDFEQKARFLRQLLKNINRFVGQREFNDMDGQRKYMDNVVKYLEPLGYKATEDELFAVLPTDAKDMMGNLNAILNLLTPQAASSPTDTPSPAAPQAAAPPASETPPSATFRPNIDKTEIIPDISNLSGAGNDKLPTFQPNIDKTEVIPDISHLAQETRTIKSDDTILENSNAQSINQADSDETTGEISPDDEKTE